MPTHKTKGKENMDNYSQSSHQKVAAPQKSGKEYLTRLELLHRYSVGNTTLYRWMNSDDINFPSPIYLSPRSPRWSKHDLEVWEAKRKEAL